MILAKTQSKTHNNKYLDIIEFFKFLYNSSKVL